MDFWVLFGVFRVSALAFCFLLIVFRGMLHLTYP